MANNRIHPSKEIVEKCIECHLCRQECAFLRKYGNPKEIVSRIDPQGDTALTVAYECSLCGLCGAVCPVDLKPQDLFLEMRRELVHKGQRKFIEHKGLLNYEKQGTSKRYTWYGLPRDCATILFPGCALPGSRPETVINLFRHLIKSISDLGIVLDCCTKPSHDLGRQPYFQARFGAMADSLRNQGIQTVLTACPNCYTVFKEYGGGLEVKTVYEVLVGKGLPKAGPVSAGITLHDPCVVRFDSSIQNAVRDLIERTGVTLQEMDHNRESTLCCGEGGAVGLLSPELSRDWAILRKKEARGRRMITYCSGCVNCLNPLSPTSHVLDLLFEPQATITGKIKSARSPLTYWNRIRLKSWFRKNRGGTLSPSPPHIDPSCNC